MERLLDFILNRHRDWRAQGLTANMRRWTGDRWEVRPMTEDERAEAENWFAIR